MLKRYFTNRTKRITFAGSVTFGLVLSALYMPIVAQADPLGDAQKELKQAQIELTEAQKEQAAAESAKKTADTNLTKAQNELTKAQNELATAKKTAKAQDAQTKLTAAKNKLTAANNAFSSVKAEMDKVNKVNSQANSSAGITNDVIFSGQTPFYVPANGNTNKPANSTLVAVEGKYDDGSNEGWTQQKTVDYINQLRKEAYNQGLVTKYVPVKWSKHLERMAQVRAVESSIYLDHKRPSGEAWHGLSNEGIAVGSAENLSVGGSYQGNIKMWVDEKDDYRKSLNCSKGIKVVNGVNQCSYGETGHYRHLVDPDYDVVGIAQFNTDRKTVNPYNTAMAGEFGKSSTSSQSSDVKKANTTVYQGIYVKTSALGSIGTAGATTFDPTVIPSDSSWSRKAQVKEAKAFAKSMASKESSRIQSNYNTKKAAVTAAQKEVNTAQTALNNILAPQQSKVNTAQEKVTTAQKAVTAAQTRINKAKAAVTAAQNKVNSAKAKIDALTTAKIYRLYNPTSHEHLFTANTNERDTLKQRGWKYEGVAWVAPTESKTPVYRLYSAATGEHHYTADTNEVKVLTTKHGWKNEGIAWYSDDSKRYPIYRQYNPSLGKHHYTGDLNEYKTNNSKNGWKGEGIAFYGIRAK